MSSAPTSPTYKTNNRSPRATSTPPRGRLTPTTFMRRKAEAERRVSELRDTRMHREEVRSQLRSAEADAGRSAAALRSTLRELDWAVIQLREAKEMIQEAVGGAKKKAHDKCVIRPQDSMQVRAGGNKNGMMQAISVRPVAEAA